MKPRSAFNGSIKDAHNTDDLNERWQLRRDESEDDGPKKKPKRKKKRGKR